MSETKIPSRIIPTMETNAEIVRCVCPLRLPSGPMIKCTRCGCLSHKKCVSVSDPFICEFCHQSAQRILEDSFGTTVIPTGSSIQTFALKDALLNEFAITEVLEIKEHCASAGQIGTLLDHVAIYFTQLETDTNHIEQFCLSAVPENLKEKVKQEAEAKRNLYRKIASKSLELKKNWDNSRKSIIILSYFRDAVIQSLT